MKQNLDHLMRVREVAQLRSYLTATASLLAITMTMTDGGGLRKNLTPALVRPSIDVVRPELPPKLRSYLDSSAAAISEKFRTSLQEARFVRDGLPQYRREIGLPDDADLDLLSINLEGVDPDQQMIEFTPQELLDTALKNEPTRRVTQAMINGNKVDEKATSTTLSPPWTGSPAPTRARR